MEHLAISYSFWSDSPNFKINLSTKNVGGRFFFLDVLAQIMCHTQTHTDWYEIFVAVSPAAACSNAKCFYFSSSFSDASRTNIVFLQSCTIAVKARLPTIDRVSELFEYKKYHSLNYNSFYLYLPPHGTAIEATKWEELRNRNSRTKHKFKSKLYQSIDCVSLK